MKKNIARTFIVLSVLGSSILCFGQGGNIMKKNLPNIENSKLIFSFVCESIDPSFDIDDMPFGYNPWRLKGTIQKIYKGKLSQKEGTSFETEVTIYNGPVDSKPTGIWFGFEPYKIPRPGETWVVFCNPKKENADPADLLRGKGEGCTVFRLVEIKHDMDALEKKSSRPSVGALPIPVLKDSPSWIFRSTHIVKVRIIDFAPAPTETTIPGNETKPPMMTLDMSLRQIIKGNVAGLPGEEVQGTYIYYPPNSPAHERLPGVFSYFELAPGQEYYLFCELSGQETSLEDVTIEHNLKQVFEATPQFVKTIEFIQQLETKAISNQNLLGEVGKILEDLDEFFLQYLLAKPSFDCLKDHRTFESLMGVLESPKLARNARTFLVSELCSLFIMQPPKDAWFAERFAVSLFRLLQLEQADVPNNIGTFLPNHLGIEGGGNKLKAKDVFKNYPAERGRAIEAIKKHGQEKYTPALLNWLGQEVKKMEQDELITLGRDECVRMAFEIFKTKHPLSNFSPELFSRARVWIQGTGVWVIFSQDVEYYPQKVTLAIRSVALDLVSGVLSVQDADDKYTCFVHTPASQKAMDFVLNQLRQDKEIGRTLQGLGSDRSLKIEEKETYYEVTLVAQTFDYSCRVDKKTGMITNRVQGELEPAPYAKPEEKPRELL